MSAVRIDLNNLDKSNWKTYRFDEIAKNISERVDPNNTDLEVYIGLEHIDSESLHIKRHGTPDDVNGQKLKFYKSDIIFGRRRAYQRKAGIATTDGFCSAHALVLRANQDVIDPQLFPFFLHSDLFMNRAVDISVGSLSPTINWGTLKHQEFRIPSKDQQAELAKLLWTIDTVLSSRFELLKGIKSVYLSHIEKKLLSKNSNKVLFSELGAVIRGVGYKPENLIDTYSNEACIILRANNIKNSSINFDDIKILPLLQVKRQQLLKEGDFAICMSNGSKDLVGKSARISKPKMNVAVGSFCAGFRPNSSQDEKILEHLFASESYRLAIKRILTGSTINNLKPSDIEGLFLRIDMNDIDDVICKLNVLKNNIRECESSICITQDLHKSIIKKVF